MRVLIVLGWFASAVVVVVSTARQSAQIDDLVGEPRSRRDEARQTAVNRLLRTALQPASAGIPEHYELRLFLPDDDGTLVPEYERTPSVVWNPGRGAVGMAWTTNGMVVAEGDAVRDATYNLTSEEQERFSHLEVVAANPVQNARGRAIGVLAASSKRDDGYFRRPAGQLDLVALSEVVARILIDIARVERD